MQQQQPAGTHGELRARTGKDGAAGDDPGNRAAAEAGRGGVGSGGRRPADRRRGAGGDVLLAVAGRCQLARLRRRRRVALGEIVDKQTLLHLLLLDALLPHLRVAGE